MSPEFFKVDELRFLDCGPFSFSLERGECLGIYGDSGVGKTQMLRALSDLIPSKGNIRFLGNAKNEYIPVDWRSKVTMLPTDSVWWYEDVASHFNSTSELVILQQNCNKLGLNPEIVNWDVGRLSTGEKQRLAILRSLEKEPTILLVDEPTSALDAENVKRVEDYFLHLTTDKCLSLMWVSHDETQLKRMCDRVLVMEKEGFSEITSLGDG